MQLSWQYCLLIFIWPFLSNPTRSSQPWRRTAQPRRCSLDTGSSRLLPPSRTKSQIYDPTPRLVFLFNHEDFEGKLYAISWKAEQFYTQTKKTKKMVGIVEHLRKGNDKEGCLLSSVDLDRKPHRTFLKMYKVHALVHVRRSRWRKGAKSKSTWLETARPTVRNVLQKNIVNLGWKAALTNLLRVTFSCFFKSSSIQRGPTYWPLLLEILYSNVTISAGSVTHRSAK